MKYDILGLIIGWTMILLAIGAVAFTITGMKSDLGKIIEQNILEMRTNNTR